MYLVAKRTAKKIAAENIREIERRAQTTVNTISFFPTSQGAGDVDEEEFVGVDVEDIEENTEVVVLMVVVGVVEVDVVENLTDETKPPKFCNLFPS